MTHVLENGMADIATDSIAESVAVQDTTLAALAEGVINRVAKFFAETMDDPDFCGIAVDQKVTDDGRIASLTLIPCDNVGGTPIRRVAR